MTRMRRWIKVVSWVLWSVVTLGYAVWLMHGHVFGCEDPAGSSNYGQASWQWWPPGTKCSYDSADLTYLQPPVHVSSHVDHPGVGSEIGFAVLVVWLAANVQVSRGPRRSNARPSP